MTKPNKQRAGLQKKVSSVFKGVSIPGGKRTGEPSHTPASDRNAASPNSKPDESRSLYSPEADNSPQGEVLARGTDRKSTAVAEPSISTDVKISQSRPVEEPAPRAESPCTTVPEPAVTYAPAVSTEPKTVQEPATEKSDKVDEPADEEVLKKAVEPAAPTSTSRQSGHSSIMARLDESEEPEDAVADSPSDSADPKGTETPADQPAAEKKADSAPPVSAARPKPSPLAKKLAQTDESTNESAPSRAPNAPASRSANRQTSQARKSRDARQSETPPAKPAAADPFADMVDEGGFLQRIKDKLLPSEGAGAKDKVMVLLVPVLAIVMIFVFRQVLHKSPGKAKGAEKKDKTAVAAVDPGDQILWTIPEPLPAMTRDPLKLAQPDESENPDQTGTENPGQGAGAGQMQMRYLQIRDIVHSHDRATALVGNQIVRAGSTINGITIVRINKDSVELERNGETWVQRVRD